MQVPQSGLAGCDITSMGRVSTGRYEKKIPALHRANFMMVWLVHRFEGSELECGSDLLAESCRIYIVHMQSSVFICKQSCARPWVRWVANADWQRELTNEHSSFAYLRCKLPPFTSMVPQHQIIAKFPSDAIRGHLSLRP